MFFLILFFPCCVCFFLSSEISDLVFRFLFGKIEPTTMASLRVNPTMANILTCQSDIVSQPFRSIWHIFVCSCILCGIFPGIFSGAYSDMFSDIQFKWSRLANIVWHFFWQIFWYSNGLP